MTDTNIHLPNSVDAPLVDPEFIANKHKDAFVAASDVLRQAQDWPTEVVSEADVATLTAGVRSIRGAFTTLDNARDGERRRFTTAATEVQGLFKPRLDKLVAAKDAALATLTRHNSRVEEAERIKAKEAADRERAESERRAEAAAAMEAKGMGDVADAVMEKAVDSQRMAEQLDRQSTGRAADLVRTRTEGGTLSSSSKTDFEIIDAGALRGTLGPLADYLGQDAIDKAIRAYVKAQKLAAKPLFIVGVRFFDASKAIVR